MDIRPAARFEVFLRNLIGLAQDGKTNPTGMPNLLQLSVLAKDFNDVIRFLKPSKFAPGFLLPMLAPIGRLLGYRGSYSAYLTRPPLEVIEGDATLSGSLIPANTTPDHQE